jgi:hypothetical protein
MRFMEMINVAVIAKATAPFPWVFALVQMLNTMARVPCLIAWLLAQTSAYQGIM